MKEYKPTKAEALRLRREEVRWAKENIKSLMAGMGKYEKGSNVEGRYLEEKMKKLQRTIKRMIEGD